MEFKNYHGFLILALIFLILTGITNNSNFIIGFVICFFGATKLYYKEKKKKN